MRSKADETLVIVETLICPLQSPTFFSFQISLGSDNLIAVSISAGDLRFDFWTGQIGRTVATAAMFFSEKCCREDGPRPRYMVRCNSG